MSAAPQENQRRRGRPPGSKNKNRSKKPISEISDEVQEEVAEDAEGEKLSKEEKTHLLFGELNAIFPTVSIGEALNGCMYYKDRGVLGLENYHNNVCTDTEMNKKGFLVPPVHYMPTMASVEMVWRTVGAEWLNSMRAFWNTGPCLQLCRRNHTPNLPEDFRDFAYLVNCINSLPNYDGCVVPTDETRLKWNKDFTHVEGIRRRQPPFEVITLIPYPSA